MPPTSRKIYKYVGPDNIEKVFYSPDAAALKCSVPKDFNDPYELFLTIDFNEKPDALAYYADAIGDLPQFPTTCFSRSPVVVPMWAHYAQNHEGFLIEFSEDEMAEAFPKSRFDDVGYSDVPDGSLSEFLYRAFVTGKPRHTYFLQHGVFNAAYFTKATCWSYEQERRMVVSGSEVRQVGALTLVDVPIKCITSIIAGSKASENTRSALRMKAEKIGCQYFDLRIGKSSVIPYFVAGDGRSFSFDSASIAQSDFPCETCKEPLSAELEMCSWCQIDDELRRQVALRNPFRILDHYGLLEGYLRKTDAIGNIASKKKK
jgi:hypothetical protein